MVSLVCIANHTFREISKKKEKKISNLSIGDAVTVTKAIFAFLSKILLLKQNWMAHLNFI